MAAGGQTINDRLNAVRHALAGQGLARTVCKATTLEVLGPKKKHIDYLLACTNEPNVSTPQLANLLIERTQHTNWAVVFKALISIHHLMSYGNERFTQYLATSNHSFELVDFMDRTTPQGYNMSSFVRRYAKYINDKSISYRTLAIDLCRIRSGNDNALRTMNMENLSKTLPIVQAQFDSLLEFGAEPKDLNNGVIMAAFRLLYKDLVRLYVAYQEAIINLLERYFKLSRKKTREALELYKNYLARMDKVDGFLRVVDAVELDKSEMPDLKNSPASILKLLEQHLAQLEAKKRGTTPVDAENEEAEEAAHESGQQGPSAAEKPAEVAAKAASPAPPPKPAPPPATSDAPPATGSEKHSPPQKPARPSPKASPKVSQFDSSQRSAAASPSPSPSPGAGEKKAGPPERPAKPPSRPPPPTASAPVAAASSSASSPQSTPTTSLSQEQPAPKASTTTHPAAPPHPPPPAHGHVQPVNPPAPPTTAQDPALDSAPAPVQPELNETPQTDGQAPSDADDQTAPVGNGTAANGEAEEHSEPQAPSCSAGGATSETSAARGEEEEEQTASQSADVITNHLVNGAASSDDGDIIPPPPPPPIEDDEEALPVADGADAAVEPQVDVAADDQRSGAVSNGQAAAGEGQGAAN